MIHARWADNRLTWIKQERVSRRRQWVVTVTYQTPKGPQKLVIKPDRKCRLADISSEIDAAIREDIRRVGSVWGVEWEATGK